MEHAFAIQERCLSNNGLEAAMKTLASNNNKHSIFPSTSTSSSLLPSSIDQISNLPSTTSTTPNNSSSSSSSLLKEIESFPYLKLLQTWRKQTVKNIFERLQVEATNTSLIKQCHFDRSNYTKKLLESESKSHIWQQKYIALNEKYLLLESKYSSLLQTNEQEKVKQQQIEDNLKKQNQSNTLLNTLCYKLKNVVEQQNIQTQIITMQCLDKIKECEVRLG